MGDEVRVTVIAAGFEQWNDDPEPPQRQGGSSPVGIGLMVAERRFAGGEDDLGLSEDDFDVPDFLK
jgi:cell division protein FtsZ